MANLGNRVCSIGELAKAYYPDRGYSSALRLFHRDLRLTRGLWNALQRQGYGEGSRLFTRSQVRTIVRFLEEP